MSELKRTQLYDVHVAAGASMVDFGGWEMPIQYPSGIVAEHLYTRHACSLFDVSHMGRVLVEGPDRVAFLQHVLSSNVESLDLNMAQYCIIPTDNGSAVDDAYLYRFEEERFLLVVNAANTEKDLAHLREAMKNYNCTMTEITKDWAAIAVQGPKCKDILMTLSGGVQLTEPMKNALGTVTLEGRLVRVAKTGYTGEPLGFEVYCRSEDAAWLWNRLVELGAKPAGLGARDTLRLEAALPLYGHEMGLDPAGNEMPIFAVPLAKFAVSFAPQKGDFIGRKPLEQQFAAFKRIMNRDFSDLSVLPRRIQPITLLDRGVMRAGMPVYRGEKQVGWVTSGTMVPYYVAEGEGLQTVTIGDSDQIEVGETVEAIGNPLGELTFTMTAGYISALDREITPDRTPINMLQTDVAINAGNSGGPLFDMDGNVIGMTTAKVSGTTESGVSIEGLGFAIPINDVMRVVYDLQLYGRVLGRAYLGVTLQDLDSEVAATYNLPAGPQIGTVTEGSCAETAGLQPRDIILQFEDREISSFTDLSAALAKQKAGDTVTLKIYRAGAELEITLTLDERPGESEIDATEQQAQAELEGQTAPDTDIPDFGGFEGYGYDYDMD